MRKKIIAGIVIDLLLAVAYGLVYFFVWRDKYSDNKYFIYFLVPAIVLAVILLFLLIYLGLYNQLTRENRKLKNQLSINKNLLDALVTNDKFVQKDLPVGIIIYSELGVITYANDQAKNFFQSTLIGKELPFVSDELNDVVKTKKTDSLINVFGRKIRTDLRILQRTIYLRDVTEEISIVEKSKIKAPAILILSLDNIDESLDGLNLQRRTELLGHYYVAIENWSQKYNIFSMSTSDEKQMFITNKEGLEIIMEDRFSILEAIDSISKEQETGISLSIGVGIGSDEYQQLGFYANTALDLAVGRGGDQAVIYDGESEKIYGGNVQFSERITKTEARVFASKLVEAINNASSVIIMPHTDTDADAIGSALGVLEIATACGTPAKVLINRQRVDSTVEKILKNSEFEFIKLRQSIIEPQDTEAFFKGRTLLIVVDHHSDTLSVDKNVYNLANQVIIIDHHRLTERLTIHPILQYIDQNASSSVEIVTELSQLAPIEVKIPNFIATIMLIGMIIDTNNFANHTTDRTFQTASVLTSFGADTHEAKRYLRQSVDEQVNRVALIQKAEILFDHYAIIIDNKGITERDVLSKTADALLNIENIEAAFSIGRLSKDTVGISARSDKTNVHVIMEQLGGGGHFNAAGVQIKGKTIDEVYNSLVSVIKNSIKGKGDTMKVILIEDVKKQGKKGDTIDVSTGYGSYLLSKHLAIEANASNLAVLEEQKANEERRIQEEIAVSNKLKQILSTVSIKIKVKTGENGKIFGSVSTKDIAEALKKQQSIDVDKRKIVLPEEKILSLGTYPVTAKLYKDITAKFEIQVVDEEEA